MKPILALAALLLTACGRTSTAAAAPDAQWLLGRWVLAQGSRERSLAACDSHSAIFYSADGTYSLWEEDGRWKLQGDRLTETATSANPDAQPVDVEIGRTFSSRVERLGADEMRKRYEDGTSRTFFRCPASR